MFGFIRSASSVAVRPFSWARSNPLVITVVRAARDAALTALTEAVVGGRRADSGGR
jgi:hypothetical protein